MSSYLFAVREFELREMRCREMIHELELKLLQMETRYRECIDLVSLAHKNRNSHLTSPDPLREMLWERQLDATKKKLSTCNPIAQLLLKTRIQHLEGEVSLNVSSKKKLQEDLPNSFFHP